MKKIFFILSVMLLIISCDNQEEEKSMRLQKNINRDWHFTFSSESDDFSKENSIQRTMKSFSGIQKANEKQ